MTASVLESSGKSGYAFWHLFKLRGVVLYGQRKKSYFLMFCVCTVAQDSKNSFPQTADEMGNVDALEVSCGSIPSSDSVFSGN